MFCQTRMTIDIVPISEEHAAGFHACLDAVYERVGFAHEGRKRNRLRFDGATFDALVMGLPFDAAST